MKFSWSWSMDHEITNRGFDFVVALNHVSNSLQRFYSVRCLSLGREKIMRIKCAYINYYRPAQIRRLFWNVFVRVRKREHMLICAGCFFLHIYIHACSCFAFVLWYTQPHNYTSTTCTQPHMYDAFIVQTKM